jgi:hypothetical protein
MGAQPELRRTAWQDVPERLRSIYKPSKPIYTVMEPIEVIWQDWRIAVKPGFITDLASIPWIAGRLGINRNNKSNWMDLGAVLHDGLYYGAAKLSENRRRNRKLADQLLLDVWHWSSGKRFRPRIRYTAVRLGGWVPYKPDYSLHDGEMMVVARMES